MRVPLPPRGRRRDPGQRMDSESKSGTSRLRAHGQPPRRARLIPLHPLMFTTSGGRPQRSTLCPSCSFSLSVFSSSLLSLVSRENGSRACGSARTSYRRTSGDRAAFRKYVSGLALLPPFSFSSVARPVTRARVIPLILACRTGRQETPARVVAVTSRAPRGRGFAPRTRYTRVRGRFFPVRLSSSARSVLDQFRMKQWLLHFPAVSSSFSAALGRAQGATGAGGSPSARERARASALLIES